MKTLPNNGLTGDFVPCEEGILEEINHNFLLIDSIMQLRVIDFVETLPNDPNEGDIYILETPSYSVTDNSIMVFNGSNWLNIPARSGYEAYVGSLQEFYVFNGSEWALSPRTDGDVKGPNSSLSNSIAIFDNATGKFISDSDITIESRNTIMGVYHLESESIVSNKIGLTISEEPSSSDELPAPNTVIKRVTSTSLITNISAPAGGYSDFHIYVNETGGNLVLENNANIRTGTGSNLSLKKEASVIMVYGRDTNQWFVVGGSGSGGGLLVVADLPALYAIPEADRTDGMLVQVISEDTIYKLIGLPAGATTTDANWDSVITGKASQTITNKIIDGGVASNTRSISVPKNDFESLKGLVRTQGSLSFGTDNRQLYVDNVEFLKKLSQFEDLDVFSQISRDTHQVMINSENLISNFDHPLLGRCFEFNADYGLSSVSLSTFIIPLVPKKFRGKKVALSLDYVYPTAGISTTVKPVSLEVYSGPVLISDGNSNPNMFLDFANEVTKKIVYVDIPSDAEVLSVGFKVLNNYTGATHKVYATDIELGMPRNNIVDIYNSSEWRDSDKFSVVNASGSIQNYNLSIKERVSGDSLDVIGSINFTGPSGTFSGIRLNLLRLSIDFSKLGSNNEQIIGGSSWVDNNIQSGGIGPVTVQGTMIYIRPSATISATANSGLRGSDYTNNFPIDFNVNDKISFNFRIPILGWTDKSPNIILDTETFDSSKAPLTWSNVAISDLSPIGTVNTFTYANGGNVRTLVTNPSDRPTQSNNDFSIQGLQIFGRAYNAPSTPQQPCCFEIKIGKDFKGNGKNFLQIYKDAARTITGSLDMSQLLNTYAVGAEIFYNPQKGTIIIDAGKNLQAATTTRSFSFADASTQANGFLTITAAKTPAMSGMNAPSDYVVRRSQTGTSWYELWNSGWVRQGARSAVNTSTNATQVDTTISFLVSYRNGNYGVVLGGQNGATTASSEGGWVSSYNTTNFVVSYRNNTLTPLQWVAEGFGNSAAVRALGANPQY